MKWECEWCSNRADRISEIVGKFPERCRPIYCHKCKAKTYHAPMKDNLQPTQPPSEHRDG